MQEGERVGEGGAVVPRVSCLGLFRKVFSTFPFFCSRYEAAYVVKHDFDRALWPSFRCHWFLSSVVACKPIAAGGVRCPLIHSPTPSSIRYWHYSYR